MKASFYAALFLCLVVMINLTLWIGLSLKDIPFDQAVTLYLSYFPFFLRNVTLLTLIAIALSGVSIYLLDSSRKLPNLFYQRVAKAAAILNCLMISLQAFSLM